MVRSYFYVFFQYYDSISTWYNIDDTKAVGQIKTYDIKQGNTPKQGKTHCGRGLLTDPIAHVVKDLRT